MKRLNRCSAAICAVLAAAGCGGSNSGQTTAGGNGGSGGNGGASVATSTGSGQATSPFDRIYNVESLTYDGDYVVITTKDLPDHKSPFYPEGSAMYEAYNGTNPSFSTSINLMGMISDPDIKEQNITFRIPRNPQPAASHQATSLGPIGIALNGVVIFNQYNGMGALLGSLEQNNFDQYNGHPTPAPGQQYHYHIEPLWLTKKNGSDSLVGFLLDGFPVYGPVENGKRLTSADLDDYHGHSHATADYPQGIYHYHCTDDAPWINGDGYYGTPGTVTH
jgi:hypothetical protein